MKKSEAYHKALTSPKWQKRRLEIMERDNFTCQFCGDNENTLNVHHLHYKKGAKPWEYDDEELVTLCENCHKHEHELRDGREVYKLIRNLRKLCPETHICGLIEAFTKLCECNIEAAFDYITRMAVESYKQTGCEQDEL